MMIMMMTMVMMSKVTCLAKRSCDSSFGWIKFSTSNTEASFTFTVTYFYMYFLVYFCM